MDVSKAFGKAIKLRRIEVDLTQEALADKARMSRSFVSGIERGEKQATVPSVYKLAEALDTQPSRLWQQAETLMASKS
ncbi:MAG: helix-turn-helix transcriptional regulator [Pseudomonadales bacterium]|nr:helix-turn-helix transcriptional regulator [Pseudomonadales bacterium]